MDILEKIKKANLIGRGGACFPVADKWSSVAKAMEDKATGKKECYVVCNASEGEPGVKKDGYILEYHSDRVIEGIKIALKFLSAKKAYLYLNPHYYKKYKAILKKAIVETLRLKVGASPWVLIEIFIKPVETGYIGGEETTALNVIEGKRAEPRLRPPFPPTAGLWGSPTLVNNVETFYNVSLVARGEYKQTRFYTVDGDCLYDGVYSLPENYTVEKVLRETHNYPSFPFFVQVGGDGSGEVLNEKQLKRPAGGAGSIRIYSIQKYQPKELMLGWINFFSDESCGQCTPCREGTYRLKEILNSPAPDWEMAAEILNALSETAFCGLGCVAGVPIISYVKNVLNNLSDREANLPAGARQEICECF